VIELAVAGFERGDEMMCSEVEYEVEELELGPLLPPDRHRHLRRHGNWLHLSC
jgi:hypothetical protein